MNLKIFLTAVPAVFACAAMLAASSCLKRLVSGARGRDPGAVAPAHGGRTDGIGSARSVRCVKKSDETH